MTSLPAVLVDLPDCSVEEIRRLESLQEQIGYRFSNPALLRVALTVGSWANEHKAQPWPSNACLEFLGDAVLDLVAADALWQQFPELGEGPLTRLRSSMVSEPSLVQGAKKLDLGAWLWVGKGDEQKGARERHGTLADALEAVLGAVFLDAREKQESPIHAAGLLFHTVFGERLRDLKSSDGLDVKSQLQQRVQAAIKRTPVYVVDGETPPPDSPSWRARVEVHHEAARVEVLGRGEGRSLRDAERAAAKDAIERWEEPITPSRKGGRG